MEYNPTGEVWKKGQYTEWLKEKYRINDPSLSFRQSIGRFFRIAGKKNSNEYVPLKDFPGESMKSSIDILIKLFNRNKEVEAIKKKLENQSNKLAAYKSARRYSFVPSLVKGKRQYDENDEQIKKLQIQLDSLCFENDEEQSEDDIERGQLKLQLQANKLRKETELQFQQRRLDLLNTSLEYGLYPTEADLVALQEFFPDVNIRKLYEIEKYHKKLATILDEQFSAEVGMVQEKINTLENDIEAIEEQIDKLGFDKKISREFLDKHSEIKGRIEALRAQNESFLTLNNLKEDMRMAEENYKQSIGNVLAYVEKEINVKMREYNSFLFTEPHKAPILHFNGYDSYKFWTPDDTGTGTDCKGVVLYDLAILCLTPLPAVAHDSILLKNIGDKALDGILKLYNQSNKQIFISLDKQTTYLPDTQEALRNNMVLQLSDGKYKLYGESWNSGDKEDENEL